MIRLAAWLGRALERAERKRALERLARLDLSGLDSR